jgi:hypothetical protein
MKFALLIALALSPAAFAKGTHVQCSFQGNQAQGEPSGSLMILRSTTGVPGEESWQTTLNIWSPVTAQMDYTLLESVSRVNDFRKDWPLVTATGQAEDRTTFVLNVSKLVREEAHAGYTEFEAEGSLFLSRTGRVQPVECRGYIIPGA